MALSDRTAAVAEIKRSLVERGVSLDGPCGAFAITQRVAWSLRDQDAWLLEKTSGNNCHGYAVDIIAFGDGSYVDMLIDSGGANTPAWNVAGDTVDRGKLRHPFDPGDAAPAPAPPPSAPPVEPPPLPGDPNEAERFVEALERIYDGLAGIASGMVALEKRLADVETHGIRIHL